MTSSRLGDHTSPEAGNRPLLLVPLGSTEQHGPHLPLATDSIIAGAWADGLARALSAEGVPCLVAPLLPYGSAGEHQSFPGTLSIGQPALREVLIELVRSAAHHHRGVVLVSGHAGNAVPLHSAAEQLTEEGHQVIALLPRLDGADAHAGRTETSLMLHLRPELVRLDQAAAGATAPITELLDAMRSGGVAAVSENGVLGDPTGASAAEGAELLNQLIHLGLRQTSLLR